MIALDSTEVGVGRILIQCHHHREGTGTTMVIMIVTCLGLGRTLISGGKYTKNLDSKDMYVLG